MAEVSITDRGAAVIFLFFVQVFVQVLLKCMKEVPVVPEACGLSELPVSCPVLQGTQERVNTSQSSVVLGKK